MTIQEDKIERRKVSEHARQERLRRKAGMPTRGDWESTKAALLEWLKRDLYSIPNGPSEEALTALCEDTRQIIKLHLERPEKLRPSAVARELNNLAKGFQRAAEAAEKLGSQGLMMVAIASESGQDPDLLDPKQHILYLQRMAAWSSKAAQTAQEHSKSAQDNKGGPTRTQALRAIVAMLILSYEEILGIRPTHTVDKVIHLAERGFTGFVKEALRLYAPEGVVFEPRLIDTVVQETLPIRDLEFFDPPLL